MDQISPFAIMGCRLDGLAVIPAAQSAAESMTMKRARSRASDQDQRSGPAVAMDPAPASAGPGMTTIVDKRYFARL